MPGSWSAIITGLFAVMPICGAVAAQADEAMALVMNQPARITARAQSGLFTAIARAGGRLVAVGEAGHILLSDDNGNHWRQVPSPTSVTLTNVVFSDAAQGWVTGQMGVVLHSQDGGQSWQRQLDGPAANNIMRTAAQADIIAHGHNAATEANLQSAQALQAGGPSVPFLSLLPVTPRDLLLVGGFGLAMQSTDGGGSWVSIASETANPQGLHLYAALKNAGHVFLAGEQGLVLSGPAAGPFQPVTTPFAGTYFGGLITKAGDIALYGLQGTIIFSGDAGAHWQTGNTGVIAGIDSGIVLQNGDLLFGDAGGDLLLTKDEGKHFTSLLPPGAPISALAQAADGAIIIGRPAGLQRLALSVVSQ